ncbi:MAG TPA: hypothetical protein VMV29_01735 [Ktedonobacterales bacterium]|nr:hypothetical protein [Ktedonobacterales bacterium]
MMTDDERDTPKAEPQATELDDPYGATPMTFGAPGGPNYQRPRNQGALGTPPGYWRKFFLGSLVFVGGSYVIILGLTYVALNYPTLGLGGYIQPPKANVLVLSGLTWENLIFFVVIIGLWLLVQRLGLMPRPQPYTPQPRRGASGAGNPFRSPNEISRYHSSQMVNDSVSERDTSDERDDRSE